MTIVDLIKSKPYLLWHVKEKEGVSTALVVETILNYGDFSDVKKMIKILGIRQAAAVFRNSIKRKRNNYRPEIKHYFSLYFKKYV